MPRAPAWSIRHLEIEKWVGADDKTPHPRFQGPLSLLHKDLHVLPVLVIGHINDLAGHARPEGVHDV